MNMSTSLENASDYKSISMDDYFMYMFNGICFHHSKLNFEK